MREWLGERPRQLVDAGALEDWLDGQRTGPWTQVLGEAIADFRTEAGDGETGVEAFVEWLAEWGREPAPSAAGPSLGDRARRQGTGVRARGGA